MSFYSQNFAAQNSAGYNDDLSQTEFAQRNRKQATAAQARLKGTGKMCFLEDHVKMLEVKKQNIQSDNERLLQEIGRIEFQLKSRGINFPGQFPNVENVRQEYNEIYNELLNL